MAFFPRQFHTTPTASFTPLFRLLDDFDSYSRQDGRSQCRRARVAHWQPKFDVREVGDAYELHGELPGVDKENVQIEFTEPQTLVVRGKAERTYTAGTSPSATLEDTTMSGAITEEEKPKNDHQATVEDEAESESAFEEIEKPQDETLAAPQEKTTETTENKPTPAADKAKYWLTERSIGEFTRSFNFPARVDQDAVSASFKDGILSITVPKAKKHESRRITVN